MKILFYDLETTGLSRISNEILNIAAIVYDEDTKTIGATFNKFIKPKQPISFMITNLTGITNDMVKDCLIEGVTLNEFMIWVQQQGCDAHAGHNIKKFDDNWIKDKCKYHTLSGSLPGEAIDTLELARKAYSEGVLKGYNYTTDKGNLSFKQEYLMDYFDIGVQEHMALTDVQYDIMVYQKLKDLLDNKDYGF